MIQFPSKVRLPVANHLTGCTYHLIRCDQIDDAPIRLSQIVTICNEPDVYRWLFAESLAGHPYTRQRAAEWLSWAAEGWRANSYFCFAVVDDTGAVSAACDIKSADTDGAEVGYWSSVAHRGIMTNAICAMCGVARHAGFRSLMARVRHGNDRSKSVLLRAGFALDSTRRDKTHDYFFLRLN